MLDAFTQGRLITQGENTVEITHEALVRAWPRLRQWIDTDRAGNLIHQELEQTAAVWHQDSHNIARLYRGSRLETAHALAISNAHGDDLSAAASAFLAASEAQEYRAAKLGRAVRVLLGGAMCFVVAAAAGVGVTKNTGWAWLAFGVVWVDLGVALMLTIAVTKRPAYRTAKSDDAVHRNAPRKVTHVGDAVVGDVSADGDQVAELNYGSTLRPGWAVAEPSPPTDDVLGLHSDGASQTVPVRCPRQSGWRTFAEGVASIFDFAGITSVSRRTGQISPWEHLQQCLTEKYGRLEQADIPDVNNSGDEPPSGNSNDGALFKTPYN